MYDYKSDGKQLSTENEVGTFEGLGNTSSDFKLQRGSLPQWAVDWARNKFNMDAKNVKFYITDEPKTNGPVALAGGNSIFVNSSYKNDEEVIKHELTHVYQQAIGSAKKSNANDPDLEREAIEVSNGKNTNVSKNSNMGKSLVTPKENTGMVQGFYGNDEKTDDEDEIVVISPSEGTVLTPDDTSQYRECERIKIDESVSRIDSDAFKDFESLSIVDMPSVTEIGFGAFDNCTNLKEINAPNVNNIAPYAFSGCTKLNNVEMSNVVNIDTLAFKECRSLSNIYMPKVTRLGEEAFRDCAGIISVNMPKVDKMGKKVFYKCGNLKEIHMPSVTEIDQEAFYGCKGLDNIDISKIKEIDDSVFYECESLTKINMLNVTKIGRSAFGVCQSLSDIDMPNVTDIGSSAFSGCKSLEKINIPNVIKIGSNTFANCENLMKIDISKVMKIDMHAFNGCTGLKEINMPKVTKIGKDAFSGCTGLKGIDLSNIDEICDGTFMNCTDITKIDISKVAKIGKNAFNGCTGLKEINMKNVIEIGADAFYNCYCLGGIIDMPNVVAIGKNAFYSCMSLSSVGMDKVMLIGESTFSDCMNLKNVDMPIVISIDTDAFKNCVNLKKVTLPYYCNFTKTGFSDDCEIEYDNSPNLSNINKLQLTQMYELKKIKQGCFLENINIDNVDFANEGNYYLLLDALYSKRVKLADVILKFNIKQEDLLTRDKYGFDIYDACLENNWISEEEVKRVMPNIDLFLKMNTDSDTRYYLDKRIQLNDEFKENLPNFERLGKIPENIISEFTKNYRRNDSLWNGMRSGIYQYSGSAEKSQVLTDLMPYMRNTGEGDIELYRGIKDYETIDYMANMPIGSFEKNDQCVVGREIFDKSFSSMTIDKGIAESYSDVKNGNNEAVFLEIKVPKGVKLNMMPIANENDEVVFNRFQKLKVNEVRDEDNVKIIECEAIEDKDNLCKTEKDIYESNEFKKYQEEFEIDLGRYLYKSDEAYAAVHDGIRRIKERGLESGLSLKEIFYSNERILSSEKYNKGKFSGNITEFNNEDLTDEKLEYLLKEQKPTDEDLQSPSTAVAGNLREKLAAFQFAVDDGTIDRDDDSNQEFDGSKAKKRKRPDDFEPHIERRNRTDGEQKERRRDFDYQDKELQLFRSARERKYQERFAEGGKSPITYGGMLFQPQYNGKDIDSFYGKRLVAGTSGTTMRLLSKYRSLNRNKTDILNFRLALMACMLPEKNHSLYEILQASHEVGIKGYENLSTADTMDKTIDPLGEEKVEKEVCKGKGFPFERTLKEKKEVKS